jgi:hypothetical protein
MRRRRGRSSRPRSVDGIDLPTTLFNLPSFKSLQRDLDSSGPCVKVLHRQRAVCESSDDESTSNSSDNEIRQVSQRANHRHSSTSTQSSSAPSPPLRRLRAMLVKQKPSSPKKQSRRHTARTGVKRGSKDQTANVPPMFSPAPIMLPNTTSYSPPANGAPYSPWFPVLTSAQSQPYYTEATYLPISNTYPSCPPLQGVLPQVSTSQQSQTTFCNVPTPVGERPVTAIASKKCPVDQQAEGPVARQLRNLQDHINRNEAALCVCPHDEATESQLRWLRTQLNAVLNMAAVRTVEPGSQLDETKTASANSPLLKDTNRYQHTTATENSKESPTNRTRLSRRRSPLTNNGKPLAPRQARSNSVEAVRLHHICYGCGNIRSNRYHKKHPLVAGQKTIRNFCEGCRLDIIDKGAISYKHFCYSCGRVRSKDFHIKHPAEVGGPLVPNYCQVCTNEMRDSDEVANCSIVSSRSSLLLLTCVSS